MKFIVFLPDYDVTNRMFDDIKKLENVCCQSSIITNRKIEKLYSLISMRLNIKIFAKLWMLFTYNKIFREEVVFLYLGSKNIRIAKDLGYINYIKRKNHNSRHVLYFLDIHAARKFDMVMLKQQTKYLFIFDKIEAKNMNINYYPLPYSKIYPKKENIEIKKSHICFVGQAKTRYEQLIEVFEFCENIGIVTNFNIIGIPDEKQKYKDKINYIDFIPYEDALQVVLKSNCSLELRVEDVTSFSIRVQEALANGKKILTNNKLIEQEEFYDSKVICLYENIKEVDPNFIKTTKKESTNSYNHFSPIHFLNYLESLFELERK